MKNTETLLIECLEIIGNKISDSKYLKGLLKKKQKFENWFQVELATCLNEKMNNPRTEVLIEGRVDKDRHADVLIKRHLTDDVAIEIKPIVKNVAIAGSRKSLLNQMHQNDTKNHSYGVALLVADNVKWFQTEADRIVEYCKEKDWADKLCEAKKCNIVFLFDYTDDLFCIKLLKHERNDGKS